METQATTQFINEQQSLEMKECFQNPLNNNFPEIVRNSPIMGSIYLPLFQRFLSQYPNVKTTMQAFKAYSQEKEIWRILDVNEREKIINILKKDNLIDDGQIFKLLNAITVHFILMEAFNVLKNDLIKNTFQELVNMREENKLLIKLKKKFNRSFNIYTEGFINLLNYLKLPATKPVSKSINLLLLMMIEAAQESNITYHYSKFLIPTLKLLKQEFPLEFREIKHFGKIYLMKRVRMGRAQAELADEFILRGGYADAI